MEQPKPTFTESPQAEPGYDRAAEDWRDWGARYGGAPPPPPPRGGLDFSAVFVLLDTLRRAAPGDLQDRFSALIKEALLTLRSLIDWYLERLENPPREPRVEDIPIQD